ncbi:piRNA biogenesis protein EXD1 isoform X5 [Heterocephalus glaber]|uniref:PiRNA biogenesis protein EXD1 isoform X5 n=1 Tax=Heterocephalus glaber TaxID=10181 RepID=A0AAX6RNF6_HETGA|nr:piRNA biogenesis protein EXD1 isoform X5 [Heterocephalus glaber]
MDPSNDYHFLNQILWRRVKLTLVSGVFEGVLHHVDPDKIVVLKKVKNVETGQNVPGVKIFFGHEIVNVEPLDEVEQGSVREKTSSVSKDSLNTEGTRMEKMKGENLKVCEPTSPALKAPIAPLLNDLKNSPSEEKEVTYTVIDQFQQKFGAAMLHIKKQSVLSVAAEGPNVCRHGKLYWLQVADVFQFSMETGGFLPNCISTLQQSLIRHLNVAPKYLSFLEDRQKLTQENPEVWFTRPLPPSLLKMLALEVTYLLPLRTALLDEMMSDLTTLVGGYLKPCREGSADQLAGAQPTCMELPEELLQLKDFQKQRRERAVKEYRMNARGLLIRTMLHPKQSETATAGKEEKVRGFLFSKDSREDKLPSLTSHEFHEDGNFSKGKFQTIVKSQHLPPIHKGEASEGSSNKLICLESKGSQDVKVTQTEHFMLAKHEFQSSFSLKEEREQLLILEDEEYLLSTKPDVSVPPFLPQESRVSPNDTFHPFKEAGTSTLPPCPALEKTGSWISPSLNLPEGLQFA